MTAMWIDAVGMRLALERALSETPRLLTWTVILHVALAVIFAVVLAFDLPPVQGVHPALKPLKFAISIALFLATMILVLPALGWGASVARALGIVLSTTMLLEMACIVVQAARGTRSHFNVATPLDAAIWRTMVGAIVVATLAMAVVALLASLRPLVTSEGRPMGALMTAAWRAGLWLFLLAAVSGFAMGGRLAHSVGGEDGGVGLPLLGWSMTHGDLRAAHFVALHALQALPLVALVLERTVSAPMVRAGALGLAIAAMAALSVGTLVQAFAGRPVVTRASNRGIEPAPSLGGARDEGESA